MPSSLSEYYRTNLPQVFAYLDYLHMVWDLQMHLALQGLVFHHYNVLYKGKRSRVYITEAIGKNIHSTHTCM